MATRVGPERMPLRSLRRALASPDPDVWRAAVRDLALFGGDRARVLLARAYGDPRSPLAERVEIRQALTALGRGPRGPLPPW